MVKGSTTVEFTIFIEFFDLVIQISLFLLIHTVFIILGIAVLLFIPIVSIILVSAILTSIFLLILCSSRTMRFSYLIFCRFLPC